MSTMSLKERLMRTYQRKKIDKIVWQPRFMYWYSRNNVYTMTEETAKQAHSPVPEKYWGKEILEIHDMLRASPRYPGEALPGAQIFSTALRSGHEVRYESLKGSDPEAHYSKMTTPVGSVTQASRSGYQIEHPVKQVEDLKVIKYLVEHQEFHFNDVMYDIIVEEYGDRGVPCSFFPRSPIQRCILEYLGFEKTALFLRKYKDEMHEFLTFIDEWSDGMFDIITHCPIPVINFGENVDSFLNPPHWYERYQVPYFEKRVKQVHAAGKFCHAHFDGNLRDLLPLIDVVDFDGIEAATPRPQGDVTLEEIKDAIGNKILLDGIPATLLMKQFPEEKLVECVQRIFELFSPNLILGISDEMPPNAEITRMELVADMVDEFQP